MERFIPHMHVCELRLCRPGAWKSYCPLGGELSESEDECEECVHFVTIDFDPDNPLRMKEIIRM